MNEFRAIQTLADILGTTEACALCGHLPACGYAKAYLNGNEVQLCHENDHSCYHRWTVYGDRPDGAVCANFNYVEDLWDE